MTADNAQLGHHRMGKVESFFTVPPVRRTFVTANVDDDPEAELQILVDGLVAFTANDIML